MKNVLFALRALSPLHCGIGQGLNDIDLPTARHAVSGHPIIPGSSLKGVLKNEFVNENGKFYKQSNEKKVEALFGGHSQSNSLFASAVSIGDATTLALPVRSFFGTFAYLVSPYTLQMLKNQFDRLGETEKCPKIVQFDQVVDRNSNFKAIVTTDSALCRNGQNKILLEEIDLVLIENEKQTANLWANLIAPLFFKDEEGCAIFKKRFAIVDDNVFNFLAETGLPINAHIAIDEDTGAVKPGALWYEETVCPETLLTGVATIDRSYNPEVAISSVELAEILTSIGRLHCQIGGKATTGKGFVAIDFHSISQGSK